MNKYMIPLAFAAAVVTTPAVAGTLQAEVRLGGVTAGQSSSTEYKVEYWDNLVGNVVAGAELQTKQGNNAGSLGSKVSVKAGLVAPTVAGFHTTAYGEVGKNLKPGNNFEFWGAGVKTTRDLIGPVALSAGYRHRQGFNGGDINENRLNAGLSYRLNDSIALGASYYRTTGTTRDDAVGLSISKKF